MSDTFEVEHGLPDLTAGHFLSDIASRHADREAIVFEGDRYRYRDLGASSRELARALIGAGVGKGERVAILSGNTPEWVETYFAVGLVGAVLVPVNTFATAEERDYILRHSDASLLLVQPRLLKHRYLESLLEDHPDLAGGVPGRLRCRALPQLRRVVAIGSPAPNDAVETLAEFLEHGSDVSDDLLDAVCAEVTGSDDAIVIYTSGTTAAPKAVLHRQRAGLINALRFRHWMNLDEQERLYTAQPFFWSAGIAMSLLPTLEVGGCLLLQDHFDPSRALEMIEKERATTVHAWTHQHKAMGEDPSVHTRDLRSVMRVDPSSPLAEHAGIETDTWGLQGSYGLSEAFTIFTALPADAAREDRLATSGRVLPGNRVRIVDPASGAEVATGHEGEIAIRGTTVMRGYYKTNPEDSLDPEGAFLTGDAGHVDEEGNLYWTGRLTHMIKSGGANISPVEIETALREYPPLKVALPVGVSHPSLGEIAVLCAVRQEGETITESEIRAFLRGHLAAYKVPRRVLFFDAAELSYTSNDKIQLEPLRALARARLAGEGAVVDGHHYGDD